MWILNGSVYGPVHQQRGIIFTLSGAGAVIKSSLYIPCNSTINNNTDVMCKVADSTLNNVQISNSSKFTLQGNSSECYSVYFNIIYEVEN